MLALHGVYGSVLWGVRGVAYVVALHRAARAAMRCTAVPAWQCQKRGLPMPSLPPSEKLGNNRETVGATGDNNTMREKHARTYTLIFVCTEHNEVLR